MTAVVSIDPRTGEQVEVVAQETSPEEVDRLCESAAVAAPDLEATGRAFRERLLQTMADRLEERRAEIVALADRETAIGDTRLNGELARTCYQLRLFAEVLDEGSYLEAAIDPPASTPMGPRPDLRRMLVPIGPVAVFGASNFPLAFSVPGGDTVSALAAGCPVIVKAHPSHPATSELCFETLRAAVEDVGAPDGTIGLVHGHQAGAKLVAHPAIRAVGFTGSLAGGRALLEIINQRPTPVPFYGELSSLNPVIVTPGAARERGQDIGRGLVQSFTTAAGQLCTKPGLVLVPVGEDGDAVVSAMAADLDGIGEQVLLNERIASAYRETTERLRSLPDVESVARDDAADGGGYRGAPLLLQSHAELGDGVLEEVFGPIAVVVRYDGREGLDRAVASLPSSLTATVHSGDDERSLLSHLTSQLRQTAGRLIYNGYPTGVTVSWAQHHGGPWPATNSLHTSVGTSAIRRFLRPVTWQDAPQDVLPEELRDGDVRIPRRVDGQLVLPRT